MRKELPCCKPVTRATGTTKTLFLRLLMVMYLLAGTFIISSGQLAGTAPVNPPIGGMKIDGFVERQSVGIGDWTAGDAPLNGAGTYVFHPTTGAPLLVQSYHLLDLWNDQVSDDIFDGGNKLFQNPNVWGWRSQKPPAKDDMHNVGVLLTMDPATGHIWLCISGDRMSTNGTSYLDFELYQNSIFKIGGPTTGGFNSTGPNGGRTIGDLSITLQYTAGGSFANVSFLKWRNVSETEFDYVDTIPPAGTAYAAANGGVIDVPYGAFGETTYQPLQFIEGAIDITRLIGAISNPAECGRLPFKSLFVKTKSSAERTADLKDFISPLQLNACFDRTPPTFTVCPPGQNLGCNPAGLPLPAGAVASDNCGVVTVSSSDGMVQVNGCQRTQVRTYLAEDACGNTATCTQTFTWTVDTEGPAITITGGNLNPGCNPVGPINFGTASATDNCSGSRAVTSTAGSITTTGCTRTQTMTWNSTDACSNSSSTSRTATWTVDTDGPVITITGGNLNPGCNPASIDFGSASATDVCSGTVPVTSTAGSITTTGCTRTQTMTWNASDACNNSSSTSRTATWTVDTQGPVITITGGNLNPGCNPASIDFGSASANDNCSGARAVTSTAGSITTSGCTRTQTMTWNASDACGNASSTSRTATWTVDVTPPVFTNPPASVDLDCSAAIPTVPTVTATDNCGGTPGVVYNGQTDNPSNCQTGFQRIIVRTWTATDACGNTAVHTQTIRVKCCVPICTLTQGGYGQYGGNICLPNGTTVLQHQIMVTALDGEPGDSVVFGRKSNNRYWVISLSDVNQGANSNILKMLPGGGGSFVLGLDNYSNAPKYSNTPSWPVAPLQPNGPQAGRIKNTLLAQTITFYFNTTIAGSGLGSLILNGDSAIISERVCGSSDPVPGTRDTVEIISPTIVSYMASHGYPATAAGLLQLANDALGGVNISPLSLGDVAGALDRINNVFDNCVLFEGYVRYVASNRGNSNQVRQALPANELNVTAFPNPYEEQNFSLRINAPVSGQATIEFFTIDGQKISEIKRPVVANRDELVTFKVPGLLKAKIAYVVNVGKYNSKGIVLSPN